MKISIIVNTYNWPQALDICLKNLLPQIKANPLAEVLIADDGSTNETRLIIEKYQPQIPNQLQHIWHEDDGFRRSLILNKAVVKASGDYITFLDGDCIVFPDYLIQQLKLATPGYLVAGNRILLSQNFTNTLLSNPEKATAIFKWSILGWIYSYLKKQTNKLFPWLRLPNGNWRISKPNRYKYAKGCNLGLWRSDFIKVNGFDQSFIGWGHEDLDLFVRLNHANIKIKNGRFALPVLHLWHKESSRDSAQSNYQKVVARMADKNFIKAESGINDIPK